MRKMIFVTALFVLASALCSSCGDHVQADIPAEMTAEAVSLLQGDGAPDRADGSHGGQQTRICRTAHGTYAAFVSSQEDDAYRFHIVRIDGGEISYLYSDTCPADAALVNIAQDTSGDVYVTAFPADTWKRSGPRSAWLALYVIDPVTDGVTVLKESRPFVGDCSYGYAMPLFDFERRRIYAVYAGIDDPGRLAWFTFDMDRGEWEDGCICAVLDGMAHTYFYCFPDGNGGAVILGERDIPVDAIPELRFGEGGPVLAGYLWDQLDLIFIPDMKEGGCSMVSVQAADYSMGADGIAPINTNNQYGDAFMDGNGLLHIIYLSYFADYGRSDSGTVASESRQIRHAVFDGTECLFNERLPLESEPSAYAVRMTENTGGELYIVATTIGGSLSEKVEIYRAEDPCGEKWLLEKTMLLSGFNTASFSISSSRGGSLCDGTVDCLAFAYRPDESGETVTDLYYFTADIG